MVQTERSIEARGAIVVPKQVLLSKREAEENPETDTGVFWCQYLLCEIVHEAQAHLF